MIFNMGGGSENLTEQMTQLETVVTEIEESLVGKASGANITPQTVLAGYTGYKNKELVTGEYDVSNLVPENVREGMSFGAGLIGAMSEGVSGIDYGEVTLTSVSKTISFAHNLKTTPKIVVLVPRSATFKNYSAIGAMLTDKAIGGNRGVILNFPANSMYWDMDDVGSNVYTNWFTVTDATVSITDYGGSFGFCIGTYTWIVL